MAEGVSRVSPGECVEDVEEALSCRAGREHRFLPGSRSLPTISGWLARQVGSMLTGCGNR
jgi:hypothetical protein